MKLGEAEQLLQKRLAALYDAGEAAGIASRAIEGITALSRSERLAAGSVLLTQEQEGRLHQYLERLENGEPIQYILAKAPFFDLELYVDKDVLIPRPETEELVHWIIKDMQEAGKNVFHKGRTEADHTTSLKILDVGTGSGCIALALKRAMPLAEVWGCDISDGALNVARRNGSEADIRVDFQSVDFLDPEQQRHLPSVDVVVSNPPYVPQADKNEMRPNVLQFEPHTALFVPDDDPLLFYKSLLLFSRHRLHTGGVMYMELHENFGAPVRQMFENEGFIVELRKDMQGKDRMLKAELIG